MLKEELEKQLDVEVSQHFYEIANTMYEKSNYPNNRAFCEDLNKNVLLMTALKEIEIYRDCLDVIEVKFHRVKKTIEQLKALFN